MFLEVIIDMGMGLTRAGCLWRSGVGYRHGVLISKDRNGIAYGRYSRIKKKDELQYPRN